MPKSTNNNGLRDAPSLYSFVQTTETNPQNPYFMIFFFKSTRLNMFYNNNKKDGYTRNPLFTLNELEMRSTQH